jgi:hypothetical protein
MLGPPARGYVPISKDLPRENILENKIEKDTLQTPDVLWAVFG